MGAFGSSLQLNQRKDMSHQIPSEDAVVPSRPARLTSALQESRKRYWRSNLKIMMVLLAVWAIAGLGCGVLFADALNLYSLGGYPLGFWFAQQGSIIVFVLLILIYSLLLNRLDARHHTEMQSLKQSGREEQP
jgi:putative solute:sodium symporter small subunit